MKLLDRIAQLDRAQRTLAFRLTASGVIVLLTFTTFLAVFFAARDHDVYRGVIGRADQRAQMAISGLADPPGPIGAAQRAFDSMILSLSPIDAERAREQGLSEETIERLESALQPRRIATGFALVGGLGVLIVWLGLGLSMLGLLAVGWGAGLVISYIPGVGWLGMVLLAATPLALAFLTGMEVLRLALGGSSPVSAVARNVLSEAVRMKISIVFIVLLIMLLAVTPSMLNTEQPLRYRVQTWLQYGTGFAYMVLALLTLFFSTASVAFEQRDRIIWQTMVKPVRSWQYLLGKWLGVVALNAVLLTVSASGVFLFTEYLRRQPAQGEMAYQVRMSGEITRGLPDRMTEDRRLLESQVLVARVGRFFEGSNVLVSPALLDREVDAALAARQAQDATVQDTPAVRASIRRERIDEFERLLASAVDGRIEQMKARDPSLRVTPSLRQSERRQLLERIDAQYRTIPAGGTRQFLFTGLDVPRSKASQKLTLRYKVNAGSNDPSVIFRIVIGVNGQPFARQVGLDAGQQMTFDRALLGDSDTLVIDIHNDVSNDREINFEPDGLEVLYVAGGYEINFVRIMFTMWVKLSFIAAVGIAASTFLGFPVACLVTMSILFMAESAGFLTGALENYTAMTTEGRDWVATIVRGIAVPIAWTFRQYAELKPTANLVEGRLVGWVQVLTSTSVLIVWTAGVLGLGWLVFRQRELALYSGK